MAHYKGCPANDGKPVCLCGGTAPEKPADNQKPPDKPKEQGELRSKELFGGNVRLPNDTKIRFCNALDALRRHGIECRDCATYIKWGDGDLCAKGKDIIAAELAYADTNIEFPPNVGAEPPRKEKYE